MKLWLLPIGEFIFPPPLPPTRTWGSARAVILIAENPSAVLPPAKQLEFEYKAKDVWKETAGGDVCSEIWNSLQLMQRDGVNRCTVKPHQWGSLTVSPDALMHLMKVSICWSHLASLSKRTWAAVPPPPCVVCLGFLSLDRKQICKVFTANYIIHGAHKWEENNVVYLHSLPLQWMRVS